MRPSRVARKRWKLVQLTYFCLSAKLSQVLPAFNRDLEYYMRGIQDFLDCLVFKENVNDLIFVASSASKNAWIA